MTTLQAMTRRLAETPSSSAKHWARASCAAAGATRSSDAASAIPHTSADVATLRAMEASDRNCWKILPRPQQRHACGRFARPELAGMNKERKTATAPNAKTGPGGGPIPFAAHAARSEVPVDADAADIVDHVAGREVGDARNEREGLAVVDVHVEVFDLGAPLAAKGPFQAGADGPAQVGVRPVECDGGEAEAESAAAADVVLAVGEAAGDIGQP